MSMLKYFFLPFFSALNAGKKSLGAMTRGGFENIVIVFWSTSVEVLQVDKYGVILSNQAEGVKKYVMIKYYVLFAIIKTTSIKNICIARIKTMNEIQCA